ncbi:TRAP-type C4-dicarboxylate transport system, substrate-binding protein [Desulfotomaculum arcticum]|uniref:TRAP-type C4-dicarboxylate transport system, substrate-binding protein n=1 Tax=Desulfotruncus arcticus DSM 17038 TaxID=1121424 RepID=A0A1I2PDY2_9FIRM|nr:TRAP transporter substrate-binding protein [Desulfotruncus arcticus]SFG11866.1 TRAP-type C4-dicarboxylate transport system, substrate-binding protein [Desulfotomaculum arcticum] [Desulfotruncus arcticus DSM 17038]
MHWSKKRSLFTLIASLFALSIIIAGCGGGASEQQSGSEKAADPVKWTANSVWPPENHQSIGLQEFADQVKEATEGQVEITVSTGGALGYKGPELLKVVRDGLVPVSDMLTSGVAGDEPIFEIVTLPFLIQSFEEGKILNDIARPYFDQIAEEKWNQKILYIAPWPAAGLWSKEEVTSVDGMKGLKTRTYDKNGGLVMEAVGGTPYPLPFSEVYSSLATGVIDSVLTSTPTAVDAKFWEVLKYYSPMNVTMATDLITVNLDEFNKLDPETQEILIATGKEIEAKMWEDVAKLDKDKEALCNENGIVTVPPSQEFLNDLSDITKDIRDEWLQSAPPEAKEIVDAFQKEVGRE